MDQTQQTTEELFEAYAADIVVLCGEVDGLAELIHDLNKKWWTYDLLGAPDRNKGEAIALMHSELSECLEAVRKDAPDSHLPNFKGEIVELADCVIRILDYCAGFEHSLGAALYAKLAYNASRADHKLENRMKEGGKKI